MQITPKKILGSFVVTGLILTSWAGFAQSDVEEDFFKDPVSNPVTPEPSAPTPVPKAADTKDIKIIKPSEPATLQKPSLNYDAAGEYESHPFFDWSKHQGETEVEHPLAEKGLIEIQRDKTYIYNVPTSPQTKAGSLRVGSMNPSNLHNPDDTTAGAFSQNYGGGNVVITFDWEWQIWRLAIGKIGLTAGSGIFFAQGHGHFTHPEKEPPGLTPKETFSLAVFPTSGGAIYRVQIWDKQLLVPYGSGGLTLYPFGEFRDDGQGPKFAGSFGAYAAAGLAINMTYFDKFAAITLDREYGISRVYLTGEFRENINLDPHYDFGGPVMNFGFTAEF